MTGSKVRASQAAGTVDNFVVGHWWGAGVRDTKYLILNLIRSAATDKHSAR